MAKQEIQFRLPTWMQRPFSVKWSPCCFVKSNKPMHQHLEIDTGCVRVTKRRSMAKKCPYLDNVAADKNNITNQIISDIWFRQLVAVFFQISGKSFESTNVKVLFLICLCCILSTDVSCDSVKFPYDCARYSSAQEHGISSFNCSNLGLLRYTIGFNASKEYNATNSNSTTGLIEQKFYKIHRIYYLDLSHNKLTSVDPDIQVDDDYTNTTFQIQVDILNLSFNIITQVHKGQLRTYTGVVSLDLSHNHIDWVDGDAFVGQGRISSLNLSYNAIEELSNNVFQSLDSVRVLDLSYNKLNIFALNQLPLLSSLSHLYLNNNNLSSLTSLTSSVLTDLPHLILLDVSNNHLIRILSHTFSNVPSLKTLFIANCSIQEVSEDFLTGLHNLEVLALDHNNISAISRPIFQDTSMIRLTISCMPSLRNISHNAFLGMSNLVYLNLSHNPQISFLQPNLFTPLVNLQVLDVSNSNITQLSEITFHKNLQLHEIHLFNNPLDCSCTNAWLATEASKNHTRFVNAASFYCLSDDKLQIGITNASFDCDPIFIHNATSRISAKLGSQLLFTCQHQTDQPAVVKWTTPKGNILYQHHFHPEASQHLLTPEDIQPGSSFHDGHYWHHTSSYHTELASSTERVFILTDGSLYIDYMLKADAGFYECQVSNAQYNQSMTIILLVDCALSSDVKIFGYIVGLICAFTFFTLNVIYVIISWIARRLVNKRRREIIRQMLENVNAYKTTQFARIHENYTNQISRVRNQYHTQCARLHRNYTSQVTKVKRGCSNQVERVRDNYNSKLAQLRDYSSSQIMQIRERTNNQITRIRDYGAMQLEKLRETYKFQHQHVLKLLDTMNLDNCRNIVETECMRAESMMYDIDLLGDDDRTDSPTSPGDSEYSTAASSPSSSLEDHDSAGLRGDMSDKDRDLSMGSSENSGTIVQVQTTIDLETRLPSDFEDPWKFSIDSHDDDGSPEYPMDVHTDSDRSLLQLRNDRIFIDIDGIHHKVHPGIPLPTLELHQEHFSTNAFRGAYSAQDQIGSQGDVNCDALYMTPEASPTKVWSHSRSLSVFENNDRRERSHRNEDCDITFSDNPSNETIV